MDKKSFYAGIDTLLILLGLFLIVDRLYLHWIYFDYGTLGIRWINAFVDHWMVGVIMIAVGIWDLKRLNKLF